MSFASSLILVQIEAPQVGELFISSGLDPEQLDAIW